MMDGEGRRRKKKEENEEEGSWFRLVQGGPRGRGLLKTKIDRNQINSTSRRSE